MQDVAKLIEQLRSKFPEELEKEPLLDELEASVLGDEDGLEDEMEDDMDEEEGVTPPQDILGTASDEDEEEDEDDLLF